MALLVLYSSLPPSDKSALLFSDLNAEVTADYTFSGAVTFSGGITITGDVIEVDSQITTADSVIDMNDGEAGSGVTLGYSGLLIDRGSKQKITGLDLMSLATTQPLD